MLNYGRHRQWLMANYHRQRTQNHELTPARRQQLAHASSPPAPTSHPPTSPLIDSSPTPPVPLEDPAPHLLPANATLHWPPPQPCSLLHSPSRDDAHSPIADPQSINQSISSHSLSADPPEAAAVHALDGGSGQTATGSGAAGAGEDGNRSSAVGERTPSSAVGKRAKISDQAGGMPGVLALIEREAQVYASP